VIDPVKSSHAWYDVTVTTRSDGAWSQRFVGHFETGKDSIAG
jgi:phospholipase C